MSELSRVPELSDEVAGLAWEAAQASNVAFDELIEVDARIASLKNAEQAVAEMGLPGVELTCVDEAHDQLNIVREKYQVKFSQLQDIAGIAMYQPPAGGFLRSPWSYEQILDVEPIEIPEVDAETREKLEAISHEYAELVINRYGQKFTAVEGYIKDGRLPEAYRLPELSALVERAVAVAPTLEYLKTIEGSAAELEFAPQGLSCEQWNDLLKGHTLSSGHKTEGNWYSFTGELIDPVNGPNDESLWDVVVIAESLWPTFTNVSKDGEHGSNAKKALKAIKAMPGVTQTSPTGLVAEVSPSEATYNAAQLSRLERSQAPLDLATWTISRENVEVEGVVRSVVQDFNPVRRRQVRSDWYYLGYPCDVAGIRLSASGKDLVLKSQA